MSASSSEGRDRARRTAEAVGVPILEYGRGWMMADSAATAAAELGFDQPFGLWVVGRAGVLGDVDADVAAAAIGFMAPDRVRDLWEGRPDDLEPRRAATAYAGAAAAWGRRVLADVPTADLEELDRLADRVAAAATASIGVLFAGWRALDRPADPHGRVTVTLNVLRELRGGAHLSAVHATGLGPHGAILAADDPVRGGVAGAERFGWAAPHPDVDRSDRVEAEHLTTAICAPAFAALDPADQDRLVDLVGRVRAAIDR